MPLPKCVPDYDALRKVPPPAAKIPPPCDPIFVSGYPDIQFSGLQGFFAWRPDSLELDDGGAVIKPAPLQPNVPGRWRRVYDGALSVKWFGARGDSSTDDIEAIQACVNAAASAPVASVRFPPGRYRITRAIVIQTDDFTISGDSQATLVLDPALPAPGQPYEPEAILVNRGVLPNPPAEVKRTTIRDLTVEVRGGSDLDNFSAGAIQVNNCADCLVRGLYVFYAGPAAKPKNIDGIVTSQGTTGLIQGCTVDGIPKGGIYIAQGCHDLRVDACESRNVSGPIGQAGIVVSGADRITIHNCLSHHNGGPGLLIAVNGPIGGNPPVPATNIQVIGGAYHDNGQEGIRLSSGWDARPQHIQIAAARAENNQGRGISVEAGWDVVIDGAVTFANGFPGIWLENLPSDPKVPRTTRVTITNADVYDNGVAVNVDVPGIGLRATDQVTIAGGKFSKTGHVAASRQEYGVAVFEGLPGARCTNLRVFDPDASVSQKKPIAALDINTFLENNGAAAQSGFYRLQSPGVPEGEIAAPPGSQYVDLSTGFGYRKSSGVGTTGWTQIP
jgi:hypothetical protein